MNRYIRRVFVAIIVVVLLVSCQQPTPEEPLSDDDGIEAPLPGESPHYAPWYLSFDLRYKPELPEVSENLRYHAIQFPTSYSLLQNGIELTVEFFQEYYRPGELIQARLTISNHSDTTVSYSIYAGPGWGMDGGFWRSDGETLSPESAYSSHHSYSSRWEDIPDVVMEEHCAPGETQTVECTYIADPAFFCPDGKEQIVYFLADIIDDDHSPFGIRIPIRVVIR